MKGVGGVWCEGMILDEDIPRSAYGFDRNLKHGFYARKTLPSRTRDTIMAGL